MSETVGWQSDPNGRGTFTLVSSCLLTLTVCVYSAMHLNVPPPGESVLRYWLRNIRWALLGIFGPELVVFIAWKQYLSARAIAKSSQNGFNVSKGLSLGSKIHGRRSVETHFTTSPKLYCMLNFAQEPVKRPSFYQDTPPPWTVVHGFYAGMGGFTFPPSNFTTNLTTEILKSDCKRLTLTARGVSLLADCNLLPSIKREFLEDKSKSDGLSKFIACAQAAWLIVQVIGRFAVGLQVTLLEINTLGHVLCALLIYVLWWHKPRMVLEPIMLDGDGPLCAYMYISSRISGQTKGTGGTLTHSTIEPELSSVAFFPDKTCNHCVSAIKGCHNMSTSQASDDTSSAAVVDPKPTLRDAPFCDGLPKSEEKPTLIGSFGERPISSVFNSCPKNLNRADYPDESQESNSGRQLRMCLAAEAVRKHPAVKRRFTTFKHSSADGKSIEFLQETEPEELIEEHSNNWSTRGLLPGNYGLLLGTTMWFASMAFGAIHVAAWFDYFPSQVEAWFWRCSAIYITSSGLLWAVINLVASMCKPFDDYWNRTRMAQPPFARSPALVVIGSICGSLYAIARIYLVIEAFASIRKLPTSAYQTPDWTQMIPHL